MDFSLLRGKIKTRGRGMSQKLSPAHALEKRVLIEGIEEPLSWTMKVYEKKWRLQSSKKSCGHGAG